MHIWSVTFESDIPHNPNDDETFAAIDIESLEMMLGDRWNQIVKIEKCGEITIPDGPQGWLDQRRNEDAIETAWVIISNGYGGDWGKAPTDWREAAYQWRDNYVGQIVGKREARQ